MKFSPTKHRIKKAKNLNKHSRKISNSLLCIKVQRNLSFPVQEMSYSRYGEKQGWDCSCMSGAAKNTGKKILMNHEWLNRRDEVKIPHTRRSRKWGIFILSQLLSHDVMSEEIYPSLFLSRPGVTFPFLSANFNPDFLYVLYRLP